MIWDDPIFERLFQSYISEAREKMALQAQTEFQKALTRNARLSDTSGVAILRARAAYAGPQISGFAKAALEAFDKSCKELALEPDESDYESLGTYLDETLSKLAEGVSSYLKSSPSSHQIPNLPVESSVGQILGSAQQEVHRAVERHKLRVRNRQRTIAPHMRDRGSDEEKRVFICHAEVDKQFANVLRDYIRTAGKEVDVFVASHPESLPGGHEWWDDIRDNLKRSRMVLTLVSPRSKDRPWLHFESGGAFFIGTQVIPLAIPPERKSFPPPLGMLQGLDLGSTDDVKALVKQVGEALSVRFARSPEDLARELERLARETPVALPRTREGEEARAPWKEELRNLAARGGTVRVHPVVPAIFAAKEFTIQEIEPTRIALRRLDSGHSIYVPPYRVVGIRRDASAYILDIQGRVQWVDADSSWHYMPEELQVNDPHGLPREIPSNTEEVTLLIGKLRADGWHVAFVHEPNAKAKVRRDYQLVYGSDGRYLKIPGRPYAQLMVKYRSGAGP